MATLPPGYRRVRILKKPVEYARELLPPGRVVVLDASTADRLIGERRAEVVPEPPAGEHIFPTCPRCAAQFPIPATLEAGAPRWVQCPRCPHGWLR
jgi:predicted Zn finger-like uncharacterized protein